MLTRQVFNVMDLKCLIIHIAGLFSHIEDVDFLRHAFEGESYGFVPKVYYCVRNVKERMPQYNRSLRLGIR